MTFTLMSVDQIVRNPKQPRKQFDAEPLEELAQSIRTSGLLEPILVRPDGDVHVIIAGERRWRAAQLAGLTMVDVRILDMTERDAFVLSVAENVNRADMTPMEEAESYSVLRGYDQSVAEIAGMFGKSEGYIEIRLSFLDLTPDARTLLERGQMGANLARYVAALQPGNQRVLVNKVARGEFASEIEAAQFARSLKANEDAAGFFELAEPTMEERIAAGRKATRAKRTLDKIDALTSLLSELAEAAPEELAAALGADVNARLAQIERITTVAQGARQSLRKAKACASAATIDLAEGLA